MPKNTYLTFLGDPPLVSLDPHPAWNPQPVIESFDAEGYAKALNASDDRAKLETEAQEDHYERLQECERDDDEMIDEVFEVAIYDDGRIEVIHDNPRYVLAEFTIFDVYEVHCMEFPSPKG